MVKTSTAEIKVIGTAFTVSNRNQTTNIHVVDFAIVSVDANPHMTTFFHGFIMKHLMFQLVIKLLVYIFVIIIVIINGVILK